MVILPQTEQIIALHDAIVDATGGACGMRDPGALSGALGGVAQSLAYNPIGVPEAAALVAGRVSKAHAFADGNKRASAAAWRLTLTLNGWIASATPEDLARAAILGAQQGETAFRALTPSCMPDPSMAFLMAYDRGEWT